MKHVTLRQIKIFESVARNLSFSRAAEDLHLTQPAVSMQIKQMEGLAGLPLFRHNGKRISLTEGGSLVLRHCQVILADLRAAEQSLANLLSGGVQHLRIGLITSGSRLFPHLIHSFVQQHTAVDLDMKVGPRAQLIEMLRNEQIDVAVMVRAPDLPQMVAQPFADHPFVLVAAPTHALAGQRAIPLARMGAECLIVRETGTDTRIVADDVFLGQAAAPRYMELGTSEAIKQSVMAGLGVGLLSVHEVDAEVRSGQLQLLDVQGFPLLHRWQVVHSGERPLPPAAREFRQFLLADGGAIVAALAGH